MEVDKCIILTPNTHMQSTTAGLTYIDTTLMTYLREDTVLIIIIHNNNVVEQKQQHQQQQPALTTLKVE